MKKETKELVKWLKDHLSHYRNELALGRIKIGLPAGEKEVDKVFAAIDFLNSLPEIESHLCRGGYIQDRNGTPCCDGDVIINESILDKQKEKGILYWSKNDSRFYFKKADGLLNSLSVNFKKVD